MLWVRNYLLMILAHKYLPFLLVKEKVNKVTKLTCNLRDQKYYSIHIFALKQALNQGT